jgi:hypothetical protein
LRVEVLTLDGKPYGPFTAENCVPLRGDSTRQRVTWRGAESLARASGKNVRLRFTLTSGSLYSFWVTPDATPSLCPQIGYSRRRCVTATASCSC